MTSRDFLIFSPSRCLSDTASEFASARRMQRSFVGEALARMLDITGVTPLPRPCPFSSDRDALDGDCRAIAQDTTRALLRLERSYGRDRLWDALSLNCVDSIESDQRDVLCKYLGDSERSQLILLVLVKRQLRDRHRRLADDLSQRLDQVKDSFVVEAKRELCKRDDDLSEEVRRRLCDTAAGDDPGHRDARRDRVSA